MNQSIHESEVIMPRIKIGNEMKSPFSLVVDNHYHSSIIEVANSAKLDQIIKTNVLSKNWLAVRIFEVGLLMQYQSDFWFLISAATT